MWLFDSRFHEKWKNMRLYQRVHAAFTGCLFAAVPLLVPSFDTEAICRDPSGVDLFGVFILTAFSLVAGWFWWVAAFGSESIGKRVSAWGGAEIVFPSIGITWLLQRFGLRGDE